MKDESKWWEKTNICAPTSKGDLDLTKQIQDLKKKVRES